MKKIDIKTKEAYTKDEMKRYLGALAEDFTGKAEGLSEGLKIIMEKQDKQTEILDLHTDILNRHEKILNTHTKTLDSHTKTLESHTKVLNSHTEMIGTLMEDVSIIKDDMQIVKKELKKKVDYDEFLALVQRVN